MHNVNWDALQAFLAVARTGRISAAARRLDVEHTTISRRLAALEAALGVPLFYRTNTGYTLTAHGRNALMQAEAMEHAALALMARAREGSSVIAGRVRVAMAPEFASHSGLDSATCRAARPNSLSSRRGRARRISWLSELAGAHLRCTHRRRS